MRLFLRRLQAFITKLINYGGQSAILGIVTDITERMRAEIILREKDKKLESQAKTLEEMNVALNILLEQRDKEKADHMENLLASIQKLIFPYIEKLQKKRLDGDTQIYVNIIKSNLEDIIGPIPESLSSKYLSLTPSEIQVANLYFPGLLFAIKKIKGFTNVNVCEPLISLVGTGRFELPTSTVSG